MLNIQYKGLMAILFVYAVNFGVLAAQYVFADVYNITLYDFNGNPITSEILDLIDQVTLNQVGTNIATQDQSSLFNNPITNVAKIGWELIVLAFGLQPFNLAYLLGVPLIALAGMGFIYIILMGYGIASIIRGL